MTGKGIDFASIKVVDRLPARRRTTESPPWPEGLRGAAIVQIGAPEESKLIDGGGLVIDYRPPGESEVRRIVLAFSESEMWVEYAGILHVSPKRA